MSQLCNGLAQQVFLTSYKCNGKLLHRVLSKYGYQFYYDNVDDDDGGDEDDDDGDDDDDGGGGGDDDDDDDVDDDDDDDDDNASIFQISSIKITFFTNMNTPPFCAYISSIVPLRRVVVVDTYMYKTTIICRVEPNPRS